VPLLVAADPVAATPEAWFCQEHRGIAQARGFGHWHVPTLGVTCHPWQTCPAARLAASRWTRAEPGGIVGGVITPPGVPASPLPWFARPAARAWTCAPAPVDVRAFHAGLPGYAPTPLIEVPALAPVLGVGQVFVKDESARMGLAAFKVLGASWAIHRVLSRHPAGAELLLLTASDGNHGRAVARMARLFGQRAHIFVPQGVHPVAIAAIAAEGARVTEVTGTYDDAVRRADEAAREPSAELVQDTAWPGYEQVPGWIVEGYSTLFAEIGLQLADAGVGGPGLVVIPVGVGSLAQAAVTHYRSRGGESAPALLSVEPESAAGVLASLAKGELVSVPTTTTIMAGLNCGTPSTLAWPYLREGLDAALAITDADSLAAAHELASHGIPAGPCGAASLAGALAALTGEGAGTRRSALAIGPDTTAVLLSTEGAAANPVPGSPTGLPARCGERCDPATEVRSKPSCDAPGPGMAVTARASRVSPQCEQTGTAVMTCPQPACLVCTGGPSGAAHRSPHCRMAITTCHRSRPLAVSRYSERGGCSE
jgi:diaminopropionate ammonia-lyase